MLINILTIAYPIAQSYEHRLRFLKNWKAIFTSTAIVGAVYLGWDELFTQLQIWGFNERYLTGIYIGALPMEEYGFFLTVPFACLFVYEVLNYFVKRDVLGNYRLGITWCLLLVTLILGIFLYPRIYSSSVFYLCALLLSYQLFVAKSQWLGRFYLAYFICLIPFTIMNGWLTGAFTDEPIVWYNNLENSGLRIGTIPLEDSFYQLSFLLLIVSIYERVKLRKSYHR